MDKKDDLSSLRLRCMTVPETTCSEFDPLPVLCEFPSSEQCMHLIDQRNRSAVLQTNQIGIGVKRNCFLALRSGESEIDPSSVFMPLGITVGELAVAQVLFTNEKERR
jgi:hypothetical protein